MRDLAFSLIEKAAMQAGLPEKRVFDISKKDNITQPRPRIEVDILPASYLRTGRKLAITRASKQQVTKKELYEVILDLTANVYAEDKEWLLNFEYAFVSAFPRGVEDTRGNWVKVRVEQATFSEPPVNRVSENSIKVFTKVNTLFAISLTGRITQEEKERLLDTITIKKPNYR